jgi:hypothetical protein
MALPTAEHTATETALRRLINFTASQQQTQRTVLDWLRMEYAIDPRLSAGQELTGRIGATPFA